MITVDQFEEVMKRVLDDWRALASDRRWVTLEVNHLQTAMPIIRLHYGSIHSNGMYEIAIGYRSYFIDKDGKITCN